MPTAAPGKASSRDFRDRKYGVRFKVPPGWSMTSKDHEVSTFRLDARTATGKSQMRAVASLDFNPFPTSTFSGALFYYSVSRHVTDAECAAQAGAPLAVDEMANARKVTPELTHNSNPAHGHDLENIGGMEFFHGHDEHGDICVEARDEVYTAYRKGSCYRFDLAMNTFCSASSGAHDVTDREIRSIDERMTAILSSIALDWEKTGPHAVPVPDVPMTTNSTDRRQDTPKPLNLPENSGGA
ncbi:MAG TPA: hypothetical protein VGN16_19540 [Acidobacteriaceae bacterium]